MKRNKKYVSLYLIIMIALDVMILIMLTILLWADKIEAYAGLTFILLFLVVGMLLTQTYKVLTKPWPD